MVIPTFEQQVIEAQNLKWIKGKLETILSTAAKLLSGKQQVKALNILINARPSVSFWNHDNWNGGQDTWRLDLASARP